MIQNTENLLPVLTDAAADVMDVQDVMVGSQVAAFRKSNGQARPADTDLLARLIGGNLAEPPETVRIRGRLRVASEVAYERLAERLLPLGRTPLLRHDDDGVGHVLLIVRGLLHRARQRVGLAVTLYVLTVISCLFTGAHYVEGGGGLLPANWLDGVPFAAGLLGILTAHEFGHYLVARWLRVPASLPYFIPFPLSPFGTMGAVISMTAPPRNRRQLLAIGAAGPLAGLLIAIPVLCIGLSGSPVMHPPPLPPGMAYSQEGNSLLYAALKFLFYGRWLPGGGLDVMMNSVAWAGWAGLLVTGLNLIPAGQLDGGHILDALVSPRTARIVFWGVILALAAAGLLLWQGWLLWVVLVFVFGRIRVPPLDDVTGLTAGQRVLAVLMVVIFVLVFTPIPLS